METFEQAYAVQLARDVLGLLETRSIIAEAGVWVDFGPAFEHAGTINEFKKRELECKVCADGALFVACMLRRCDERRWSGSEVLGWRSNTEIEATLKDVFSRDQLILIDVAFERGHGYYTYSHFGSKDRGEPMTADFEEQLDRGRDFCEDIGHHVAEDEYGDKIDVAADARLRKIMHNIIENQGEFKP
jgi:hypothetical protein